MLPFCNSLFGFVDRSVLIFLSAVSSRLKWIWQSQDTWLLWKWQNPNKLVVQTHSLGNLQWKLHLAIPEARLGLLLPCRSQFEGDTGSYHTKQMMFTVTDFIQYTLAKLRQWGRTCPLNIYLAKKLLTSCTLHSIFPIGPKRKLASSVQYCVFLNLHLNMMPKITFTSCYTYWIYDIRVTGLFSECSWIFLMSWDFHSFRASSEEKALQQWHAESSIWNRRAAGFKKSRDNGIIGWILDL